MVEDKYLRHVARPDNKIEREEAPSLFLEDFVALYLRRALRDFESYNDLGDVSSGIAQSYVEQIETAVRENGQGAVTLYVHTDLAYYVIKGAVDESAHHPEVLADMIDHHLGEMGREESVGADPFTT